MADPQISISEEGFDISIPALREACDCRFSNAPYDPCWWI